MRLKIFPFENEIEIEEQHIAVLYIQNKMLFNKLANTFYQVTNGQEGQEKLMLFEEEVHISFQQNVLFLSDLWNFNYNDKKILNKLLLYIENHYKLDVEEMEQFQRQV